MLNLEIVTCLTLLLFVTEVSPGANDLHFYDGASTADVIAGDVFFEILDPPELRYSFRVRPAKDFGAPFKWRSHFYDGASTADVIAGDVFFEILDPPELRYSFLVRPAKDFGAPFNESLIFKKARLVPTVPLHSCSDIVNHEDIVGHIALSERGECSFVYKTAKAQQAGARAIIITESIDRWDDALDRLIEMVDDKTDVDINIPAAFLLGRSGATILRTLMKLHRPYAIINLPVNMTHVQISKMNQPPWIAW